MKPLSVVVTMLMLAFLPACSTGNNMSDFAIGNAGPAPIKVQRDSTVYLPNDLE